MGDKVGIRLQVESYGLFRFVTIVQPDSTIKELRPILEKEMQDLYNIKFNIKFLKDSNHNDLQDRFTVSNLFKDMDQIYVFVNAQEGSEVQNTNTEIKPQPSATEIPS